MDTVRGRLVSGSYDKTLKIWDLASGRCQRTLRGHSGWVSCLRVEQGGERIVSGSWDASIKVWDAEEGVVRQTLACGVGNALYTLDLDQGSAEVAVGCRHHHVQLWDLEAGQKLNDFFGHSKEVGALRLTPRTLVTGSGDTTIKVWDKLAHECRMTLRGHSSTVMCLEYDGEHKVVSGSYDKTCKLWDLRRPSAPVHTFRDHTGAVFALRFDNDKFISGSSDCTVKVLRFREDEKVL